ncbi:ABC transporter substrate-binding protein [Nocardioides sp. TF02-7]|uniref:ABC transporter substrate-binding protein n=1 Tax=Nocardioides sp. TF02-7 TaxID=2917724 RepID=UPI001F06A556|nr:ABC transporter substrate-binding protein [Nocardioides sp. TF02-7]UMG92141.1 ABC transporter substrate-binding protein [Nocardioides sp. TF02-7]
MIRSNNRPWFRLLAGGAVLGLALTACGSEDDGGDGGGGGGDNNADSPSSDAAASLTNDECAANATSADAFVAGGILPLTGTLAYLGPPEIAGVGLAVSDINAAGGVNGADACHKILDSGDANDLSVARRSARQLAGEDPSVVVGAASSSVSLGFVDTLTEAKITQISPANTAAELTGYSDFYFRTAPEDSVQGSALGSLIAQDGHQRLAFLVFNDAYGTGLRDFVQESYEAAGGQVVYGGKGDGQEFPPGQTTFSAEVTSALNANPDAIVILAFDETAGIVPELAAQGFDVANVYMSDGNTSDWGEEFDPGTLEGAKGTIPGADASDDFKTQVSSWHEQFEGEALSDFSYAAESYDATILAALAAAKGGANDSQTVQQNVLAVSGATEGQECTSYAECLELIEAGEEIRYTGPSGIGPLNENHDPSSAFIGIYQFNADNAPELVDSVEGVSGE